MRPFFRSFSANSSAIRRKLAKKWANFSDFAVGWLFSDSLLGAEVHLPGVGQLLLGLEERQLTNVRVDRRDAIEVLDHLPDQCLERIYLFFPDPWAKIRHHKRRLVQPSFAEKLRRVLLAGGSFHAATDSEEYARHMLRIMADAEGFSHQTNTAQSHSLSPPRPLTKFGKRSQQRGHTIHDLLWERF